MRGMHTRSFCEADASAVSDLFASLPIGARHRLEAGWRLAAPAFQTPADNTLLIDTSGDLLGMVAWQQPWAVLDLWLRPGDTQQETADRALTWAKARFAQLDETRGRALPYWIEVGDGDDLRAELAARHAFDLVDDSRYMMLRRALDSDGDSGPRAPSGFTIRALAGSHEVPGYVAAHRAAFDSAQMTAAWRARTLTMPGYEPELDLVAVAEDGTVAGFCVVWLDRGCSAAQIEPIGVVPRFRRLGLARACWTRQPAARPRTVPPRSASSRTISWLRRWPPTTAPAFAR